MHGTMNIKYIEAKQTKAIYQFKNSKRKLYRTNAAIWYNKICRQNLLTPDYINIRINGKNLRCQKTIVTATQYRLNQEIKFLYIKKSKLNEELYKPHLECTKNWKNIWTMILQTIDHKVTQEMETYYNKLNRKLDALQNKQQDKNRTKEQKIEHQFYNKTANLTQIKFTKEEISLLNQGLQHSIENPMDKYWTDLTTETEQAIRNLDTKMQDPYRIMAAKKLKQIRTAENRRNIIAKRQTFLLKNINEKLEKENAMITKADKGTICVIIYTRDYTAKVH